MAKRLHGWSDIVAGAIGVALGVGMLLLLLGCQRQPVYVSDAEIQCRARAYAQAPVAPVYPPAPVFENQSFGSSGGFFGGLAAGARSNPIDANAAARQAFFDACLAGH